MPSSCVCSFQIVRGFIALHQPDLHLGVLDGRARIDVTSTSILVVGVWPGRERAQQHCRQKRKTERIPRL
jgi:hypothetical protein